MPDFIWVCASCRHIHNKSPGERCDAPIPHNIRNRKVDLEGFHMSQTTTEWDIKECGGQVSEYSKVVVAPTCEPGDHEWVAPRGGGWNEAVCDVCGSTPEEVDE